MRLTYCGIPYTPTYAAPSLEIAATGTDLGKTYRIVQSAITYRQPAAALTYHGTRHTN